MAHAQRRAIAWKSKDLVDEPCCALGVDVPSATVRSRLVILRALDTTERADAAGNAWSRLCSVWHDHAYDLAPLCPRFRDLYPVVAVCWCRPPRTAENLHVLVHAVHVVGVARYVLSYLQIQMDRGIRA